MKVSELEKKYNCIVKDLKPDGSISEKEFLQIPITDKTGVNHSDRIKFLKDNGYEVTRENMIDSSLSARPKE